VALVLAHRGANRYAPDNTLAAFRKAVELRADGVELDVHRTADDKLVVRHDASTPAGMLSEMTSSTVRAALPEVPLLDEALDVCAGRLVNVEIKNVPGEGDWDPSRQSAALLVDVLERRGRRDHVIVSSFDLPSIDRVRSLSSSVPTALLTWGTDPIEGLAIVQDHGHHALHPDVRSVTARSPEAIAASAHARGLQLTVWTVNDPDELGRLAAAGVDALITDVPDAALRALGR
jgi:glycerophosphoryl diester phosphodiesterase